MMKMTRMVEITQEYDEDEEEEQERDDVNPSQPTATPHYQINTNSIPAVPHQQQQQQRRRPPSTVATTTTTTPTATDNTTALTTFQPKSKFKFWFLSDQESTTPTAATAATTNMAGMNERHHQSMQMVVPKSQQPLSPSVSNGDPSLLQCLPNISHETNRERYDLYQHVHDIECRLTQLTADLAQECMNFDSDMKQRTEESFLYNHTTISNMDLHTFLNSNATTTTDLTTEAEAVQGTTTAALQHMNQTKHWMMLEQRISSLDAQMTHAVHVQLSDYKNQHFLQTIQDILHTNLPNSIQKDQEHRTKFEQYMLQQWESIVGSIARRFAEERATRTVALQTIMEELQQLQHNIQQQQQQQHHPSMMATNNNTTMDLLAITTHENSNYDYDPKYNDQYQQIREQMRTLHQHLEHEKLQRHETDQQIRALLLHRTEMLQQAIIETFVTE
jgi:hypothetical protein